MDCNLYEPHLHALNYSWKYLVKNGGIFLDDYFSLKYPGARIAINQFCKKHRIKIKFVKNIPGDFKRYYIKK
jgi:O-methyltransferase